MSKTLAPCHKQNTIVFVVYSSLTTLILQILKTTSFVIILDLKTWLIIDLLSSVKNEQFLLYYTSKKGDDNESK